MRTEIASHEKGSSKMLDLRFPFGHVMSGMLPFHDGPIYKWLWPKTLCKATDKGKELDYIGSYLLFYVLPDRL